jgi:hypothetical protein
MAAESLAALDPCGNCYNCVASAGEFSNHKAMKKSSRFLSLASRFAGVVGLAAGSLLVVTSCETSLTKPAKPETPIAAGTSPMTHAWLEWVGEDRLSARAVVSTKECPTLVMTGTKEETFAMTVRSQPTLEFPVLVCEKTFSLKPAAAPIRKLEVVGPSAEGSPARMFLPLPLPVPTHRFARIVVIGDTGCRLKGPGPRGGEGAYQACNDPKAWPFATVSAAAAAFKPDLVIHLGDIHYREANCPTGNKGCEGATGGYGWGPWEADFFTPARALLQAAPWLILRGNHESCARAGQGWAKLLEPSASSTCLERSENYAVHFGAHELDVIDSADEKSLGVGLSNLADEVSRTKKYHRWLLTHRPFITANTDPKQPSAELIPEALRAPGVISFAMAGHVHTFSLNRFADWRPAEIIAGNSATALDTNIRFLVKHAGDEFFQRSRFGFVTLEQKSVSLWELNARDTDGTILQTCRLKESFHEKTVVDCQQK